MNKVFSKYPCSVYLHNALRFILDNKADIAYEEICRALLKAGDELSIEEKKMLDQIREKNRINMISKNDSF